MADTDSETEIQFNFRNDVHEDGQGDVMRQAPVQTDETTDKKSHQDPMYMSEPGCAQESPMPHAVRHRSRCYENLDHLDHHHGPDRLRNIPDNGMHGDLPRYSPRRPNGRDSLSAYSPQRYEEPVVRPAVHHQHRLQVKPKFFNVEDDWDQYIFTFRIVQI